MKEESKLGIWVPLLLAVVVIAVDIYLAANGVSGDTITERIRDLPEILKHLVTLMFGVLIGHFWK